mmetsp:Transcript_4884/g.11410  ORF Transcript_4884/g.11410 Transcript_4884/m.11410 type:complete len:371 (-) Transcript_4884:261-1373(-)
MGGSCSEHAENLNFETADNARADWPIFVSGRQGDIGTPLLLKAWLDDAGEIPPTKVDFTKLPSSGWIVAREKALPDCFLAAGGAACTIVAEKSHGLEPEFRVLVLLPSWAVDLERAKWLCEMGPNKAYHHLCTLLSVTQNKRRDSVLLEFDYPAGLPLDEWLESQDRELDKEEYCRLLCRELLVVRVKLGSTLLRFWGFLNSSNISVTHHGSLVKITSLGYVLSSKGAKAMARSEIRKGRKGPLPPELIKLLEIQTQSEEPRQVHSPAMDVTTDSYAVAALVLKVLTGREPSQMQDQTLLESIPKESVDWFGRVLFADPAWRLSGMDAIEHTWLDAKRIAAQSKLVSPQKPGGFQQTTGTKPSNGKRLGR